MDNVYYSGGMIIQWIQQTFQCSMLDVIVSTIIQLHTIYGCVGYGLPLVIFFFGEQIAINFLVAIVTASWVALNLKWVFLGDRPYWWALQDDILAVNVSVVQKSDVCRTTWGNPSEQAAMAAAGMGILILATLIEVNENLKNARPAWYIKKNFIRQLSVIAFVYMFILIFCKLYAGSNFIHQQVNGTILGAIIAICVYIIEWEYTTSVHYFSLAFTLGLWSVAGLGLSWMVGYGPLKAFKLAVETCGDQSKIRPLAQHFQPFMLNLGVVLGFVVAIDLFRYVKSCSIQWSLKDRIAMTSCIALTNHLTMFVASLMPYSIMVDIVQMFVIVVSTFGLVPCAAVTLLKGRVSKVNY